MDILSGNKVRKEASDSQDMVWTEADEQFMRKHGKL